MAHFRNGDQTRTTTANSRGDATVACAVGNATPGYVRIAGSRPGYAF